MTQEGLWAVGQVAGGGAVVPLPVTRAELQRDAVWAGRRLRPFGVPAGRFVMLISMSWEGVHIHPFEIAADALAAPTCQVDPSPFDAVRMAGVLRSLPMSLVLGVSDGIMQGLEDAGLAPDEVFGGVTVLARPEALRRWRGSSENVYQWFPFGPAVAVECPARAGAHVNGYEWRVTATPTGLCVSGLLGDRRHLVDVDTGREGTVAASRCQCGSDDPRIVLTDDETMNR